MANHEKTIEILPVPGGNNYPREFGKAYGDFKMVNYGLSHSKILLPSDVFWKVTGRLQVKNIESLIQSAPKNYDIYCDLHNIPFVGKKLVIGNQIFDNKWMDLRLFSSTYKYYNERFRDNIDAIKESVLQGLPKQYFYKIITKDLLTRKIVPRFAVQPIIVGYGGYCNRDYNALNKKLKNVARSILRFITPWLWL